MNRPHRSVPQLELAIAQQENALSTLIGDPPGYDRARRCLERVADSAHSRRPARRGAASSTRYRTSRVSTRGFRSQPRGFAQSFLAQSCSSQARPVRCLRVAWKTIPSACFPSAPACSPRSSMAASRSAQRDEAAALRDQAAFNYRSTVLDALSEVENGLIALQRLCRTSRTCGSPAQRACRGASSRDQPVPRRLLTLPRSARCTARLALRPSWRWCRSRPTGSPPA